MTGIVSCISFLEYIYIYIYIVLIQFVLINDTRCKEGLNTFVCIILLYNVLFLPNLYDDLSEGVKKDDCD